MIAEGAYTARLRRVELLMDREGLRYLRLLMIFPDGQSGMQFVRAGLYELREGDMYEVKVRHRMNGVKRLPHLSFVKEPPFAV